MGARGQARDEPDVGRATSGSGGRGRSAPRRAGWPAADRPREPAQPVRRGHHGGEAGRARRDRGGAGRTPPDPRVHHARGCRSDAPGTRHAGRRRGQGDQRDDRAPGVSAPAPAADRTGHPWLGDATGALADLGVFVPLAAALILVNGLDAGALFVCAGLLVIGTGIAFKIPFPVQPLKALTAVAIARELSPDVIHAAGLELAAFLLVLSVGHVADLVARVFVKPVVRSLQLGVGVLLVITAVKLVADPPEVFSAPPSPWPVILALVAFVGVAIAAHRRSYAVALVLFAGGLIATIAGAQPDLSPPAFTVPSLHLPPASAYATAFLLLVVPQLPLTFGNAVVAVNDLAHEYFGDRGRRVTPSRVCLSAGIGNTVSAVLGGMPM